MDEIRNLITAPLLASIPGSIIYSVTPGSRSVSLTLAEKPDEKPRHALARLAYANDLRINVSIDPSLLRQAGEEPMSTSNLEEIEADRSPQAGRKPR